MIRGESKLNNTISGTVILILLRMTKQSKALRNNILMNILLLGPLTLLRWYRYDVS